MTRLLALIALVALVAAGLAAVASAKDKTQPVHHDLVIVKFVDKASVNLWP
jgi:type VI protein secretion system component Hcp